MKRIKLFLFSLIMLFMLPTITKAFTSLEISTPNPVKDSVFYIQVNLDYQPNGNVDPEIRDFHAVITFNPEYFEYVETVWLSGTYETRVENGKIYIDKGDNGRTWPSKVAPVVIRFKALKTGTSQINIGRNGESHYGNGSVIAQSFSGVTVNVVEPSTNTLIGMLGVEGYELQPTFKKTQTEYSIKVPADVSKVKIVARSSDNKQTIEGAGDVYLNYGKNICDVIVKAQDGSSKTYVLTIIREDDRTGDTSLKSISVSDTDISYIKDETNYEATVSRSVDSVLITARTNDPKATLMGTGRKALNIGKNEFTISVTSSKNQETIYHITINRSTEELEKVVKSSKLKSLKVNNLSLDLSNDKTRFTVGVNRELKDLPIEYVTDSRSAKVEIKGNKNLQDGVSLVTLKVTEVMEEETADAEAVVEETEYQIIVYKNPKDTELVADLKNKSVSKDPLYRTTSTASHTISADYLEYLNNTSKSLYYTVVNAYSGVIYQAKIGKNLPDGPLDASFKQISDAPPTYETNLPAGTEVLVYLGDYFDDETDVRVYSEDENGYKLITDGLTVINGYITVELNGDHTIIITTGELIKESGPFDKLIQHYGKTVGVIGLIIVIVILYLTILNKHREAKAKREPAY